MSTLPSRRLVLFALAGLTLFPAAPAYAELLRNASPLFKAEQIVAAIEKNKGQVTYVLYPDEGHGFKRPENNMDFFARAEAFLGGRCEPMTGERLAGSTAVVREVKKR